MDDFLSEPMPISKHIAARKIKVVIGHNWINIASLFTLTVSYSASGPQAKRTLAAARGERVLP
jgi:hypothetical protein